MKKASEYRYLEAFVLTNGGLSEPIYALKPAWNIGFTFLKVVSFPALFPGFAFDTPQIQ